MSRFFDHELRAALSRKGSASMLREALSAGELDTLSQSWEASAQPHQVPPTGDWMTWLLLAGRGAGKGWGGAKYIHRAARSGLHRDICIIAPTQDMAWANCIEGPSGLIGVAGPGEEPDVKRHYGKAVYSSGTSVWIRSAEKADRLRGGNYSLIWYDEFCFFRDLAKTYALSRMTLRVKDRMGGHPRSIITTSPRNSKTIKKVLKRRSTVVTKARTTDNRHLSDEFVADITDLYGGTRLGREELDGELVDDHGAIASEEQINATRVRETPPLDVVVIGVDPAVTTNEASDETGVVAVGMAGLDVYVLDDLSGMHTAPMWAKLATDLASVHGATRVVAEANQGGDLIALVLRQAGCPCPVDTVHAKSGKKTRSEPLSLLVDKGRLHIVGSLPLLEDQLTEWTGGGDSPDRLDALVWAVIALLDLVGVPGYDPNRGIPGVPGFNLWRRGS